MKTCPLPGWTLLVTLLALRAAPALAHGGLPETSTIDVRRGSEDDLIAGASFGAVISRDRGQTWRWICPEGMGIGAWRPERYFWLSGGELIAATGSALVRSSDGGCTWSSHAFFKDTWVTGLAVHPGNERMMYATTGKASVVNGIYLSDDGGATWAAVLLSSDARYSAIRIAPSDPRRIYASGEDSVGLFLSRSDDGGQTWTRLAQPLPQFVRPYDLILLLVSEASPEVIWARAAAEGYSYLLKSTDGGTTLTQAMRTADVIIGAEASADGRTVWVSTPVHMYRGRESEDFSVLPLPNGNACARRVGNVLYGCGSSWVHVWAMARSHDEGSTWEPLFMLSDIQGVHTCPAETPVQRFCPAYWPQIARAIGAPTYSDGGVEPSPDAGPSEPPDDSMPPDNSCGCGGATGLVPAALLFLTFTLGRRSRRQSAPRP